jgi:hypothetical protein
VVFFGEFDCCDYAGSSKPTIISFIRSGNGKPNRKGKGEDRKRKKGQEKKR